MASSGPDTPVPIQKVQLEPEDVVFAEATPQQRELISTIGENPRPPLTPEEYLISQKKLSHPGTKVYEDVRYFCLFHKDNHEMIISTCEVNPRQAIITSEDGDRTMVVKAYAISSVSTPPKFRGQEMATLFLKRLRELLDRDGYEVGVLYGAIGGEFYARLGWEAFDRRELVISLDLGSAETQGHASKAEHDNDVRLLSENEIPPLCEKDVQLLTSKLDTLAKTHNKDDLGSRDRYISLLPTYEQIAFHILRDTYMAEVLYTCRGRPKPQIYHGAITHDKKSWIYWDHGLPSPEYNVKLRVLRIATNPGDDTGKKVRDVELLLRAAVNEARRSGLEKVVVWEPDEVTVQAAMEI